jgi:hypothetical protein
VNLFRRKREDEGRGRPTLLTGPRIPRHSSGWEALLKHLRAENGLRVLDIGPTSPQNINFLTEMGHSVYMADVVHESLRDEWQLPPAEEGEPPRFDEAGFFEQNLNFHGRQFDVVLLWATLDYIPDGLIGPLVSHLKDATLKDGKVLAIFHSKPTGPFTSVYQPQDRAAVQGMGRVQVFPGQGQFVRSDCDAVRNAVEDRPLLVERG